MDKPDDTMASLHRPCHCSCRFEGAMTLTVTLHDLENYGAENVWRTFTNVPNLIKIDAVNT